MKEIKFTISPDGSVQTEVKGVKGVSCKKLTSEVEAALGMVKSSKPTAEHFEKPQQERLKQGGR